MFRANRWLGWVVITAAAASGLLLATGLWFVSSHRHSQAVSSAIADAELARVRARFSQQSPLLDMATRQAPASSPRQRARHQLRAFHTLIFDTRDGPRLVHIAVPYWFARQYARHRSEFRWLGELTFLDDTEFDPEPIQLSLQQLEQRGPGLVVDYRHPTGGQFISWVE